MKTMQFLLTLILISVPSAYFVQANNNTGFTIDIIHKNSVQSPISTKKTPLEHFKAGIERGRERARRHLAATTGGMTKSDVLPDGGEFMLKLQIGTPPTDMYGIFDTGSDLFWMQCQPCEECFKQVHPVYNPKSSSTYADIDCKSPDCSLGQSNCENGKCTYSYAYGDDSGSNGVLAKETINFGGTIVKDIVFGCAHKTTGSFNENETGMVGLGGGPLSLPNQVGAKLGTKRFSFCLVPFKSDPKLVTKMYFGPGSEVTGPGVVTTPIVDSGMPTFYHVTLNGISVAGKLLPFSSSGKTTPGNSFVDSGTLPTMLPKEFYDRLAAAVQSAVKLTPYKDPELGPGGLCYQTTSMAKDAPEVKFHFPEGEVPLVHNTIFISPKDGVHCLAFSPTGEGDDPNVGIIGNFSLAQLRTAFDLDKKTISFKQVDCTKEAA